jgi:hypothetical protein
MVRDGSKQLTRNVLVPACQQSSGRRSAPHSRRFTSSVWAPKPVSLARANSMFHFGRATFVAERGSCIKNGGVVQFATVSPPSSVLEKTERVIGTDLSLNRTLRLATRVCQLGKNARLLLSDTGTKVLFGVPNPPSTFVLHAAAPASHCVYAGRLLSLRGRDLI